MGREIGLAARVVEVRQRPSDGWEGELVPRDVRPVEKRHSLASTPSVTSAFTPGAIHDLPLADARDAVHREDLLDLYSSAGY